MPFGPEELDFIRRLDPKEDIRLLRRELPSIREAALRTLEVSTLVLKAGAEGGLSLSEIGAVFSRPFVGLEEEPSELENMCGRCIQATREMEAEMGGGAPDPAVCTRVVTPPFSCPKPVPGIRWCRPGGRGRVGLPSSASPTHPAELQEDDAKVSEGSDVSDDSGDAILEENESDLEARPLRGAALPLPRLSIAFLPVFGWQDEDEPGEEEEDGGLVGRAGTGRPPRPPPAAHSSDLGSQDSASTGMVGSLMDQYGGPTGTSLGAGYRPHTPHVFKQSVSPSYSIPAPARGAHGGVGSYGALLMDQSPDPSQLATTAPVQMARAK